MAKFLGIFVAAVILLVAVPLNCQGLKCWSGQKLRHNNSITINQGPMGKHTLRTASESVVDCLDHETHGCVLVYSLHIREYTGYIFPDQQLLYWGCSGRCPEAIASFCQFDRSHNLYVCCCKDDYCIASNPQFDRLGQYMNKTMVGAEKNDPQAFIKRMNTEIKN